MGQLQYISAYFYTTVGGARTVQWIVFLTVAAPLVGIFPAVTAGNNPTDLHGDKSDVLILSAGCSSIVDENMADGQ